MYILFFFIDLQAVIFLLYISLYYYFNRPSYVITLVKAIYAKIEVPVYMYRVYIACLIM